MGVPSCDVVSLAEPDRQSDLPSLFLLLTLSLSCVISDTPFTECIELSLSLAHFREITHTSYFLPTESVCVCVCVPSTNSG